MLQFIVGVYYAEGPPVNIPNTVVKLTRAENSWRAASRENRSTPTSFQPLTYVGGFFICLYVYLILTIIKKQIMNVNDQSNKFYKNNKNDSIWWLDNADDIKGEWEFTFDKKKFFNLFADYPHNLTPEEKEIFDKENPYWKDFFKDRQ